MLSCHYDEYTEEQRDAVLKFPRSYQRSEKEKYADYLEVTALGFTLQENDSEGHLFVDEELEWDLYFLERYAVWCLRKLSDAAYLGVGESPTRAVQDYNAKLDATLAKVQESQVQLQIKWSRFVDYSA
jgi:hypothetical protein